MLKSIQSRSGTPSPALCWRLVGVALLASLQTPAGEYFETVAGTSHMVQNAHIICAAHLKTGHIKGLWDVDAGQQYLSDSHDTYYLQTADREWQASEMDDVVERVARKEPAHLVLECRNAALPGVTIRKSFSIAAVSGEARILCRRIELAGKLEQPTLFSSVSTTVFDPDFRTGARYHYVVPQGVAGNQKPLIPAEAIARPIARRDHGTDENGRGSSSAFNPRVGAGFAQYVFKVNDQWIYPRGLNKQTYWTNDGWQIGSGGFFITAEPQSVETRYHVFFEDRLQFNFEYLELPEFKALRDATQPLPVMRRVVSPGRGAVRPGDVGVGFTPMSSGAGMTGQFRFGDFATHDDAELVDISMLELGKVRRRMRGKDWKAVFEEARRRNPNMLFGVYVYRNSDSDVFKAHPDWLRGRNAKYGIAYDALIPEANEYVVNGIVKETVYLENGLYYIDGAIEAGGVDWVNHRVWQGYDDLARWRLLYQGLHEAGKLLWTNMRTDSAFYDIAYYEVSGAHVVPGKAWRDGADADLMNKIYQVPGTMHIPLYWWVNTNRQNNARYQNLCLGLAMSPRGGAWAEKVDGDWPILPDERAFGAAVDEYRDARFARIGLEPAWWNDLETRIEAFTLALGDIRFVNVVSHEAEPGEVTVSVGMTRAGFDRSAPVFVWQHQARPALIAGSQYPDDVREQLFSMREFTVLRPDGARLGLSLPNMPVDRVRVCALTQTPAFIRAADGVPTQALLSETLGCRISGRLDEAAQRSDLRVEAPRPLQVLAYWPEAWGRPAVSINGAPAAAESVAMGGATFAQFGVPKGTHEISIAR